MRRTHFSVMLALAVVSTPLQGSAEPEGGTRVKLGSNAAIETAVRPSDIIVNFALLPLAYAFALPHGGFTRYPYDSKEGYASGDRDIAACIRTSRQFLEDGHQAQHSHFRVRGGNRLGWDVGNSTFDQGTFTNTRVNIWSGHVTANYLESKTALLEGGYGIASFQDPGARTGVSFELNLELFPRNPWTASVRYEGSYLHSHTFQDLSAHVGAAWKWFGAALGYRAFFTPIYDERGPELTLSAWF